VSLPSEGNERNLGFFFFVFAGSLTTPFFYPGSRSAHREENLLAVPPSPLGQRLPGCSLQALFLIRPFPLFPRTGPSQRINFLNPSVFAPFLSFPRCDKTTFSRLIQFAVKKGLPLMRPPPLLRIYRFRFIYFYPPPDSDCAVHAPKDDGLKGDSRHCGSIGLKRSLLNAMVFPLQS